MQVIYRITSPSDAVYIGQTSNLQARKANYKSNKDARQPLIHRSLKKYGFASHRFDVLHVFPEQVAQHVIDDYERYAIRMHRNMRGVRFLNATSGGNATGQRSRATVRALSRPDVQGENHPLAKLTAQKIKDIRKERVEGCTYRALAIKYGVDSALIGRIVKGRAWCHVVDDTPDEPRRSLAMFTPAQAEEIRTRYKNEQISHRALAAEYDTSHTVIGNIIRNRKYGIQPTPIFEASEERLK
jgi:hypothetical protein